MKQVQRISLLFAGFVGLFSGVKSLDSYSADYLECSKAWRVEIERSAENPVLVPNTMRRLEDDAMVNANNELCPGLWPDHKERLMAELNAIE